MGFRFANVGGRATLVDERGWHGVGTDPLTALGNTGELHRLSGELRGRVPDGALEGAPLGPPVPRPPKAFGVGLNYKTHVDEARMDVSVPTVPLIFTKLPTCIVGPTDDVLLRGDKCDYEGELVVVIGPGGKDIDEGRAWDHVAGLTAGQDISDRPVQMASDPPQLTLGKSFDTFGPIGPVLVSPDLVERDDLHLTTHVNGELRQDDRTSNFIFTVPELIAYLSRICTLETGDLIFTGTPAGVGSSQGKYLADGDVVTTTIDGIGTMVNRCRRV